EHARIDGQHLLAALGLHIAGIAVDVYGDFLLLAVELLGSKLHSVFDPLEDDLLGNVLVAVHCVHDPQYVGAVHGIPRKQESARLMPAARHRTMPLKTKKVGSAPTFKWSQSLRPA